jgi:hypothetical protein
MAKRSGRFWRITVMYHGKEQVIEELPTTHITPSGLVDAMKMLFAKYTLTDQEIVLSQLRRNVKRHRNLINVQLYNNQDPISYMIGDGSNWVLAIVVRPEDQKSAPHE